jgi:PAS domain S-box-containing protein
MASGGMEERKKDQDQDLKKADLRKLAEDKVYKDYPEDIFNLYSEGRIREIIHELQVHQVELEMQNEELITAKAEYESLLQKYLDMYEFAPVAYFSLDRSGIILKSNLIGCNLLGKEKKHILRKRFQSFIHSDSVDIFHLFLNRVLETDQKQSVEIKIMDHEGRMFPVQLNAIGIIEEHGIDKRCRMTVVDISEKKKAEDIIRASLEEAEKMKIIFATQEEERRRISESLHNNIAQLLYGVQIKLEDLSKDQLADKEIVSSLKDLVEQSISQTRTISFELMPPILEDFGLIPTLRELCSKNSTKDLIIHCNIAGYSERMGNDIEIAIYRISQELINNIVKHASANKAELSLHVYKNSFNLKTEDNGKGFDVARVFNSAQSMGLKNIKSRVKLMHGNLSINSTPASGTKINIEIPWRP